ncbi:MAG: AAA family ATPase [Lacunisphaera sp.]
MPAHDQILDLKQRIAAAVIGQDEVVDQLLIALLANGHLLMEGLPGLAKTRTIKTLAANLESQFSRIQFTPDLLPSDITGTEIYTGEGAGGKFTFQQGPVFGNLVLADEINRAPAKAQSALLEAMEERQVTVAGKTYPLPGLFLVLATQNPIEQEGTYPLPEAQMDRFLLHVFVGYGSDADEQKVLQLVRKEDAERAASDKGQVVTSDKGQASHGEGRATGPGLAAASIGKTSAKAPDSEIPKPQIPDPAHGKIPAQAIADARKEVLAVQVAPAVEKYIVALVAATRRPGDFKDSKLAGWIKVGASPRGTLALDRCARAHAWLDGRTTATPDDVKAVAHACLRHRLILTYEAEAEGTTKDIVLDEVLKLVAVG